jgi:single-stranded-DNA-specific exonuclease
MPLGLQPGWRTVAADAAQSETLARALGVPRPLASVLVARGFGVESAARDFLSPRLSRLTDPFLIAGMEPAAERLARAVREREPVTVFGDYDVDGVTGTALLVGVLSRLGVPVTPFLPERALEGYGFTPAALSRCLAVRRASLLVTVDCGMNAVETAAAARALGVDVIVTDHHEPEPSSEGAAFVRVNPKLGCPTGCEALSGVGVAFKLCHALLKRLRADPSGPVREALEAIDLREVLGLVALGTVCDIVPLTGENRTLVRHGLDRINAGGHPGVAALCRTAGIGGRVFGYHLGFQLGPRLNAAGRLGSADPALELLLTSDAARATELSEDLDAANRERQQIEHAILEEALSETERAFAEDPPFGLVVGREGWDVGVVGIVAARLCRRYHRPAVVVAFGPDGAGRGSCRSIPGVDIVSLLGECAEHLASYGGHKMAAGVSLPRQAFDRFRDAFAAACRQRLGQADLRPVQDVDAWLSHLGEADERLMAGVEQLEPVGAGNPSPVWGVRGVRPVGPVRRVGRDGAHVKLVLAGGATQMDGIAFNAGSKELPEGPLDVLFELDRNDFNGRRALQLRVKDWRPSAG